MTNFCSEASKRCVLKIKLNNIVDLLMKDDILPPEKLYSFTWIWNEVVDYTRMEMNKNLIKIETNSWACQGDA